MMRKVVGLGVVATLGLAGGVGIAIANSGGTRAASLPHRFVEQHSDLAVPPDVNKASAVQLAVRSFSIPGVRAALLVKVIGAGNSHYLNGDNTSQIVTDYKISVVRTWARAAGYEHPTTLRIPGGKIGAGVGQAVENVEDAPSVNVGEEFVVWDQIQPVSGQAGPTVPGVVVVPSNQNVATVGTGGAVNWAGKQAQWDQFEAALTQGAGH